MAARKHGLGRGLDALLGGVTSQQENSFQDSPSEKGIDHLPLDLIQRGRFQPRRDFDGVFAARHADCAGDGERTWLFEFVREPKCETSNGDHDSQRQRHDPADETCKT